MEEPQDFTGNRWKKYNVYSLSVDPKQDDRAVEFFPSSFSKLFARPHLRALFCSLLAYFMSLFVWFSVIPLLGEIKDTLDLSSTAIYQASKTATMGALTSRILLGPLCDRFGARICIVVVLTFVSIVAAMIGLVKNHQDLKVIRFFLGFAGGIFVICQYWTSCMFAKGIVGTANAFVAGWGRVGGYLSQKFIGDFLFPKLLESNPENVERAWRIAPIAPSVLAFVVGPIIYFISDDSPRGNFADLKRHGAWGMPSLLEYVQMAAAKHNTWLLFIQFGCCSGAEVAMNFAATQLFAEDYNLSTTEAAVFPNSLWYLGLFAGILGGLISDAANRKIGMKGRLLVQMVFLLVEGILVLAFPRAKSMGAAKAILVLFQGFSLAAQASTFAIVPSVCTPATGWVMGFVGAGGNLAAFCFTKAFRFLVFEEAFDVMGLTVIFSSVLSAIICIQEETESNGIEYAHEPESVPQDIYA